MGRFNENMSWDIFFYYGETNDLDLECEYDLWEILLQPGRSLFYNRRFSAGLSQFENNPNGMSLQIFGRYEIASSIAYRNTVVSDGSEGLPDRRIAVSQNSVGFKQENGNLDIEVLYFLYHSYKQPKLKKIPFVR